MFFSCFRQADVYDAVAVVINHQDSPFIKRIVIHMLRHYANDPSNPLDRDTVEIVEKRLLTSKRTGGSAPRCPRGHGAGSPAPSFLVG